MSHTFLGQVAQYLYTHYRSRFSDILLVVPNRRTAVFFTEELKQIAQQSIWLPGIKTINEFLQDYSSLNIAEPVSLLSHLYKAYLKISGAKESFDDFYFWGEMMLADFDNIDKYLVEPQAVFTNVKDFKALDNPADYLTKEQVEVIKKFFSEFDPHKKSALKEEFKKIWEILLPVYKEYNQSLKARDIGYEGMVYREAVAQIKERAVDDFGFSRVFFTGFNAITRCEEEVFDSLYSRKVADFFWDYDDFYVGKGHMEAGYFVRRYLKKFPPPFSLKSQNFLSDKNIRVASVPTDAGQVEYGARQLQAMDTKNYANTALVLVDEQLLVPVLHYLPEGIDDVNITMGYPLQNSNSGRFVELLIDLQKRVRINKETKQANFYYKSVLPLLRHPFFKLEPPDEMEVLINKITTQNLFYVSADELGENPLVQLVFKSVDSNQQWHQYMVELLLHLIKKMVANQEESRSLTLDMEFLYHLYLKTKQLQDELERHKLQLQLSTLFSLYRRMINSIRIPFEGEPIKGLQLMGFLETRNLDFENVVVLSVNEGLLPAATVSPSFIPHSLKRGFGLPTREQHDAMYAYYFYRLIQRAKNVTLIYNNGAQGMTTGEKSRFLHQLHYNADVKVAQHSVKQTVDLKVKQEISIKKRGKAKEKLMAFLEQPEKKLSPSALTAYLTCPLKFYYRSVVNLHPNDEIEENVDARLFGNIFHYAAEKLYEPFLKKNILVDIATLKAMQNDDARLKQIIVEAFREAFYGKQSERKFTVEGKNLLVFGVVEKYLKAMMDMDIKHAPFSLVGLEQTVYSNIRFSSNGESYEVRVGGQIDRLDRTDKGLRVIDYKTGSDKLFFTDLNEVFSHDKIPDRKAVFQTFLYCLIRYLNQPGDQVIIPGVYQVKNFFSNLGFAIQGKKEPAFADGNFIGIADDVNERLTQLLAEIFNFDQPFDQTNDIKRCEYCPYKIMCGR